MAKVIFIMTDSQRYDMVNANVPTGLKTPCLDRLASQGMRFTRAYTTQPVCQPARCALFTGMYPHSCNSWTNSSALSADVHTIGQRLRDHGVHTAYIGKWHLDGGDYFGLGHCPDGWDPAYWYDMRNYLDELTPEERVISRRTSTMETTDIAPSFTYASRCSDRAVRFLQEHGQEENFLLCVSYYEPHGPYLCPREYWEQYRDFEFPRSRNVEDTLEEKPDYQKVWAGGKEEKDRREVRIKAPYYFGCNSFVDAQIGRVLDAVDTYAGEDAVVIYTSDHGDFLESHCLSGKGPAAYDEITRIPLFIKGPGIAAGSVSGAPVSHINLAPAVFDLFGIPQPPVFPGVSLLPQARGEQERVNEYCFLEFGRYEVDHDGFGGFQPMRAVFDGRYKLSLNLLSQDEFYDLQEDPLEMVNRIDDPACYERICRLHDAILDNMNRTRDPFRGYYWRRRPWRKDAPDATWSDTGYTRQSENDYEERQLDYETGLTMVDAVRRK